MGDSAKREMGARATRRAASPTLAAEGPDDTAPGSRGRGGAGPGRPVSRHGRAALLRLAAWFEAADTESAHEIYTAAFGVHGARHLGGGPVDETVHATTSWWSAPPVVLPSGPADAPPVAPMADYAEQQSRLRDAAEAAAHWRRSAAREVRRLLAEPTGADAALRLSGAAMEVLMELLTAALGSGDTAVGPVSAGDLELDIRLHVRRDPDATLTLSQSGGRLALEELRLHATAYAPGAPGTVDPEEPGSAGGGTGATDRGDREPEAPGARTRSGRHSGARTHTERLVRR